MNRVVGVGCAVALALGLSACGAPGAAKQEELAQQVPPLGELPDLPEGYFPPPPEENPAEAPTVPEVPAPPVVPQPVTVTQPPAPVDRPPERVTVVQPPPPPPPPPPAGPQPPRLEFPDSVNIPIGPGQLHVDLR